MDATKMWDYRVVRKESEDGSDEWYSVQEVYYDDDGQPMAQTVDLMIEGDTIAGMRTQLERIINCLGQPVLDESDIIDSKNEWVCEICGKSTKDVEYDYLSGTDHLKCTLTLEDENNDTHIYESPDGGKTLYRRKMGETIRENMENLRTGKRTMTTKEKILELEMENAELRDRLDELGEMLPAQGESEDIQNTIKEAMDKERGL